MRITSTAFKNEEYIPSKYSCQGQDISPPLSFEEVPASAKSLALVMEDPDAPMGNFVHWIIWNIPAASKGIAEAEDIDFPLGRNDFSKLTYSGPCPPSGTHRYFFRLYALDTELSLKEGASRKELNTAMDKHIIAKAELMGKYSRR